MFSKTIIFYYLQPWSNLLGYNTPIQHTNSSNWGIFPPPFPFWCSVNAMHSSFNSAQSTLHGGEGDSRQTHHKWAHKMQRCSGSIRQSTNTGSLFLDNMSWHIFLEDESLHAISKLCVKCSSMLSLKVLCIHSAAILHTANRNHIMCQVVTYKKVKPMEIIQPLSQKWASLLTRDSD